ncbi:hypothetical protein HDV00_004762 [Rhizophlyctis rosea]|nr:hypothetical protein HDV00_004762 [Rhizophlyctis rosea]
MATLPDPLPTTVEELQALVREQAAALAKLTNVKIAILFPPQTPPSPAPPLGPIHPPLTTSHSQDKEGLLTRVEQNEQSVNDALQLHLSHVHREKKDLEESLASLSEEQMERGVVFEKQLKELRVGGGDSTSSINEATYKAAFESEDLGVVRDLARQLKERVDVQEALIKKLRFELEMECGHVNILRAENQNLRQLTVNLQASAEQEEEYISNKLLKRINSLKKEKSELLLKVEHEEEMITSTLQQKLRQLQKEKVDMEIALEQEQEFIVNRLQKQLQSLQQQQGLTSPALGPVKKWPPSHSPSSSMSMIDLAPISPGVIEMLKAEVNSLKQKLIDMEREYDDGANTCRDLYSKLREEVLKLRTQLAIPVDDLDKTYPPVLPTVVPSSAGHTRLERSRSTRGIPVRRVSGAEDEVGSGVGSPYDNGFVRPGMMSGLSVGLFLQEGY